MPDTGGGRAISYFAGVGFSRVGQARRPDLPSFFPPEPGVFQQAGPAMTRVSADVRNLFRKIPGTADDPIVGIDLPEGASPPGGPLKLVCRIGFPRVEDVAQCPASQGGHDCVHVVIHHDQRMQDESCVVEVTED